mgnify:FL=1
MASRVRHRGVAIGLVAALVAVGGPGLAQRSAAPPRVTAPVAAGTLPAGDGGAVLRAALAALPDVGAADHAIVSFVDHAAVRAGGAAAQTWRGLQVGIGVIDVIRPSDAEAVQAATGVALSDVVSTLVVDLSVPSFLTLVRGRIAADDVDAALSARGYAPVAGDGARRWCGPRGCDGGFDIDVANRDDAFALFGGVLGRSFAAALSDDLLTVGPAAEALDLVLATSAGLAPSLLARPEVAALVDALDVDAVVRQAWLPLGGTAALATPLGARSVLFADARRGGDEWLVVAAAFAASADAEAFAAGALAALGLAGDVDAAAGTLQAALRDRATDAVVDRVDFHGLQVVRVVLVRPFPDGVGTPQARPAELLRVMLAGVTRFAVPWAAR